MIEGLEESILLFGSDGRLVVCSEAAERLLHVSRQNVTGMRADILFPQETPLGALLAQALASRTPVKEARAGRLLASVDFLPQGAFLLRLRDAEGRRMVESQLNLSSRLAAISRLTSGVAHEIKNPLNSIALRLELLRSRVLPELPEAEKEIDVIAQEIVRLDRVVRTFLDFTRPVELQTEELDLARITAELAALLRPEAEQQGVALETEGLEESATVRGDDGLLKQALLNVLRNGLEAMPGGGRLAVRLRKSAGFAEVEIADCRAGNSCGIPRQNFQLIFHDKEKRHRESDWR